MSSIEIFYYRSSQFGDVWTPNQYEEWLYAEDGKLLHIKENDGITYLRRGAEEQQETITQEEAVKRWPERANQIRIAVIESLKK
jgi:hypothetical protein